MGILVLSRVPYLIVYWPGIVVFDTLRSYSYARGTVPWDTYEPVGHSLLIAVMQWLGTSLGWSDAGGVAIGAISVILTSSIAFSFMFIRMAVWGLRAGIWMATFAFVALLPVFGYFSVSLMKDVPFSIALVVFMVCVGELSFGRPETTRKLWPWVTLTIAGIFVFLMRKNGIHVMALTLPLLLIPLRHFRKRLVLVLTGIVAAYAVFVGPLYALLDVGPGPKAESYSVPLQQLGRIAKRHSADLSAPDREFYLHIFAGMPPEELSKHYVPWLSDPMKLQAGKAWGDHTTAEFLAGWARIAATYPSAAIGATMANTVGYWDPEGPSYDGMSRWSSNNADRRRIHLAVPGGEPKTGLAAAIESSGFFPTRTYGRGASRRRLPRYSGVGTGHVAGLGVLVVAGRRPARDQTAGSEGSRGIHPSSRAAAELPGRTCLRWAAILADPLHGPAPRDRRCRPRQAEGRISRDEHHRDQQRARPGTNPGRARRHQWASPFGRARCSVKRARATLRTWGGGGGVVIATATLVVRGGVWGGGGQTLGGGLDLGLSSDLPIFRGVFTLFAVMASVVSSRHAKAWDRTQSFLRLRNQGVVAGVTRAR